jgi:hypothetical protein
MDDAWARDDAAFERRMEYAEDLAEERRQRNAHRCQCVGLDMPGRCPGPANCPLAEHADDEEDA